MSTGWKVLAVLNLLLITVMVCGLSMFIYDDQNGVVLLEDFMAYGYAAMSGLLAIGVLTSKRVVRDERPSS